MLQGRNVLFLDCVEARLALRAGSRTGQLLLAHCTAAGKAMLAELPAERLHELYERERLPTLTPRSIAARARLLKELSEVRQRGYATNDGESEANLRAVAAVVRDRTGQGRAAITVAAPDHRMSLKQMRTIAAAIERTAARITESLLRPDRSP